MTSSLISEILIGVMSIAIWSAVATTWGAAAKKRKGQGKENKKWLLFKLLFFLGVFIFVIYVLLNVIK